MLLGGGRSYPSLRRCPFTPLHQSYSSLPYRHIQSIFGLDDTSRPFLPLGALYLPYWRRDFSSKSALQENAKDSDGDEAPRTQKQKRTRSPPGKNSLRRVAVEAQRSRDGKDQAKMVVSDGLTITKSVTAYCTAERYDIAHVARILQKANYKIDPRDTRLYPQVVHVEIPTSTSRKTESASQSLGDVFVFPSGTVVAWDVSDAVTSTLVAKTLFPAAQYPHPDRIEEEDLEYIEDAGRENSSIKGDKIVLGTKSHTVTSGLSTTLGITDQNHTIDTVLAKIAFSSGLARSTKLAALESLLGNYFESTRSIPAMLSRGGRLPFTRSFILQKTGQLLSIRAQLNLYSELTDSLPDLFWDSRHELNLEGYYDQVGKALDTNIRIKILNEKMDYAQEIASVLRQQLSEQHGVRLEWIIIALIAVEVGFAIRQEFKEYSERISAESQ